MPSRRAFMHAALAAPALSAAAFAQGSQLPVPPPAPPRDWTGETPVRYPDPDIIALDPRFRRYIIGNTPIRRLHTGTMWAEGPAWNGVGRYLVWSDIPNNVQHRWLEGLGAECQRSAVLGVPAAEDQRVARFGLAGVDFAGVVSPCACVC